MKKANVWSVFIVLIIVCPQMLYGQINSPQMGLTDLIYYKVYIGDSSFISRPSSDTIFRILTDSVYLLKMGCRGSEYLGDQLDGYRYADRPIDKALTKEEIHAGLYEEPWQQEDGKVKQTKTRFYPNDKSHIVGFAESWIFDTSTLALEKEVIAMVSAVKSFGTDGRYLGDRRLLWVVMNPKQEMLPGDNRISFSVVYDVTIFPGFDEDICESVYNRIEYSERMEFLYFILSNAYSGTINTYAVDKSRKLSVEEVRASLTKIDTMHVDWSEPPWDRPNDSAVVSYISAYEIDKLRFVEEWEFYPEVPALTKKVIAFAPLKTCADDYGELNYVPLFWIYKED